MLRLCVIVFKLQKILHPKYCTNKHGLNYLIRMHTKNYTQPWCQIIKTNYLLSLEKKNQRDKVVQIFKDKFVPGYQQSTAQIWLGLQKQAKKKLHIPCSCMFARCKSLQRDTWDFSLQEGNKVNKDCVTSSTCPYFKQTIIACKKMYYISKHHNILVIEDPQAC
ncbi:uncharacterized protein VP01_756g1 [Puccinia sorghi]|uniref:Uncharacterized protein n=1 Tax=Puccinia sorghi TaxID=27349 RepID=A0A0L6UBZ4_9BASI|nr:uncharacterized protein VP01_756g1 [Puccinia sorghi]